MSTIVIMPGGFHPFHAGHMALYNSAKKAFPNAEVYVAATNDTKTRPFPFAIKEKLARVAGVSPKHFIQVKSPFQPKEITDNFNPEQDVVIFVRSEKDKNESPKPGGMKKDGTPAYFQPWTGKNVQPFGQHAYMAYLPTVEFGPGISSATEIRNAWPKLNDKRKTAMVMSLYPATQKNPKLAANVVKMLDMGMGNELSEGSLNEFVPPSSGRGDGGDGENERSRRLRKLLEIAIRVAEEQNVGTLDKIPAMNTIAGDDFFSVAVQGLLPDITDREYMFVIESAYKTVKQGLSETINSAILNKRFKHKQVIGDYTYTATAEDFEGAPLLWIKAYDGTKEIGHILFEIIVRSPGGKRKASADYLESGGTEVDPKYRNKGVASTMYAYAKMLGNDIQASYNQTSKGKAMWKAWEKAGAAKHLVGTSMESTAKINEFAPTGNNDREPNEEEILRQLAAQWWNGTEQQMAKAQRALELMGWDIGQDESGDEDAGVFVIRIGDEHGDSYIAFPHSELSLDDINEDYLDEN